MADLPARGWCKFDFDPALAAWAAHADAAAKRAEVDPAHADWLRCGGTWFVGVNALPNDDAGRLPDGPPLSGAAIDAARSLSDAPLDRAQASVCYPGYPRQGADESDSAFRYRRDKDAAHVDGLHRIMPGRRRKLMERHAYILGIPLNDTSADAAPFVIWEGGHEIMRRALAERFTGIPASSWADEDVTAAYQTARKEVFDSCKRTVIHAKAGEAYLAHRLSVHGVAPWRAGSGRRAIAYFRPELASGAASADWLTNP